MTKVIYYVEMINHVPMSSTGLAQEVIDWLEEHNIHFKDYDGEVIGRPMTLHGMLFDSEEDAMAFKLRWL